ncbi:PREDICTED: clusterin [Poecilia mexicana]|nr:PREDICTED: clusterin [Poecilia mexicana]XP_014832718.1 PREDICTED: clusterin [Poecilia mexicana]XP_014832719.1 PREDICTED: clusterin [Poecilia mexicana]
MLMMMMMMKKKKGSKETLALLALFLASANCILPPSTEELNKISLQGEKYLDKQIENAIDGVKEMKTVMQKSSEDHKKFLDDLEKTKLQKEEAIRVAEEMEAKLAKEEEVCNDTMKALWEECKPCLKKTCVKYYSRTCSSGSGLVGRQLEDVLNRTSPFSIWINGERIDSLEQEGQRQNKEFRNLEERYSEMADGVDSIFSDSMKVADHINPPVFFFPNFLAPAIRRARSIHLLFHDPFHNFRSLFSPMMGMGRNLFGPMDSMMDLDSDAAPNEDGNVNEDVIITRPFGNGKMTCREIRRNSAGCIKFRNECEKCKEIQHLDCSGNRPLEGPLKEELEEALAMAERFTQQYNSLLKRFEERVFNTSSLLDMLNRQFGWVSSLANNTKDGIFSVKGVISKGDTEERQGGKTKDADTKVTVQLFDSPPMNVTVRGDIPWTDPKFSEEVAQKALDRYKATSVLAK